MDNLADQVIAMVAQDRGLPVARIGRTSRLVDDLGMDGDEADDFFVEFRARFGVDLAPLQAHWGRHFGPEVEWRLRLGVPAALVLAGLGVGMRSIWVGAAGVTVLAAAILLTRRARRAPGPHPPVTVGDLIEAAETGRWPLRYEDAVKVDRGGRAG